MKLNNNTKKAGPVKLSKISGKIIPLPELPLVPAWVLMPLWLISLALPNLIYSGVRFADTLHILKWTVTGVPVAMAVLIAGYRLLRYGPERVKVKIDLFAAIWALLLIFSAIQPSRIKIFSPTGYALEMVCFVTVWAFYVISVSSFPKWGLRTVLILGNLNAMINVIFAELQIRGINNLSFLQGTSLDWLRNYSTIILPTPGNYIGNTAQQNMFGLWVAVAVLGAVYLYVYDAWKNDTEEHGFRVWLPVIDIILAVISIKFAVTEASIAFAVLGGLFVLSAFVMIWKFSSGMMWHGYYSVIVLLFAAVNFWGLMNSTSRSATLALTLGLLVIFILSAWKFNRNYVFRFLAVMAVIASVFWASMYSPRSGQIVEKTVDIIQHAEEIGNRRGIWMTSYAMFMEHPEGVGIGQYKWHYLEGQREGFKMTLAPWYTWQYTHWAHNEFLQMFCEGGVIGGVMLLLMYFAWFIPAVYGLFKKKELDINAVWALGLASLISFCAVFTRPFHRIENMVWITLAFAVSNREFFPSFKFNLNYDIIKTSMFRKLVGIACILSSIAGCVYISSGIYGNYLLRKALSTSEARLQLYLLEEAAKHPIVYEETMRNIGNHYLQVGEQTNDRDTLSKGFGILWEHFNHEPHSEDISKIINFAQRFQIEDVLIEMVSYFKPGSYHLERRPTENADGTIINALLMMNGPAPEEPEQTEDNEE